MSTHKELLRAVYYCECCPETFGFTRPAPDQPYFKFPPTIGAQGRAPLLFVGINPRKTGDNRTLHERVMASKTEFAALAKNEDDAKPYIAPGCRERHYHWHMAIVRKLFGPNAKFEEHAAVTELFFCASQNARRLPVAESPCAERYFESVFLKVRPFVVLPVWRNVLEYFQRVGNAPGRTSFLMTLGGHAALIAYLRER